MQKVATAGDGVGVGAVCASGDVDGLGDGEGDGVRNGIVATQQYVTPGLRWLNRAKPAEGAIHGLVVTVANGVPGYGLAEDCGVEI